MKSPQVVKGLHTSCYKSVHKLSAISAWQESANLAKLTSPKNSLIVSLNPLINFSWTLG
jgi:hypothetical protein